MDLPDLGPKNMNQKNNQACQPTRTHSQLSNQVCHEKDSGPFTAVSIPVDPQQIFFQENIFFQDCLWYWSPELHGATRVPSMFQKYESNIKQINQQIYLWFVSASVVTLPEARC